MNRYPKAVTRAAGVSTIIMVIIAAFLGYFLRPELKKPEVLTTTSVLSTTTTKFQTVTKIQAGPTVTAPRNFSQETITELVVVGSETTGGGAFCEGNLSIANGCEGSGVVAITSVNSTSYIFPRNSDGVFLNVTLTTVTSTGLAECYGATTSTTTVSYNSTSGYGVIDYSWSQSCSLEFVSTIQNNT